MSIGIHEINRRSSGLILKSELIIINPQRIEFDLWRAASLRSLALLLGRKHAIYKEFETRTAVSQDGTTQAMAERVMIGTSILKEILSDLEAGISFRRFTAGRIAGSVAMLAFVVISLTYITLVVSGKIPAANRLKIEEVVLLFVVVLFLALAVFPDALARLSLVKLPGGVELALVQIQQKQEEQQTFYDPFFAILSNELTLPEKHHLRLLLRLQENPRAEDGDLYAGHDGLRQELFRLKRFGLIDEAPGQKIGLMYDCNEKVYILSNYVRLTPIGTKFLIALNKIESQ